MAVHLRILLILTALTGIHSITTVSKVSVKTGNSISIPCLYGSQYINNVKYLCQGYYWSSCSSAVTTKKTSSGWFSISDDKNQRIFTVTIKRLTAQDTDYWCVVEINQGPDVGEYFHLSVTTGTPSLYVDRQEVTAYKGGSITINCHHRISGQMKWCRLGRSCVTSSSGSIDGTRVTIDTRVSNVFTVTMSGLRTESSGWYLCVKGDLQMPVHLIVTERPTTTTLSTTTRLTTISSTAEPAILTTGVADKAPPTVQGKQSSNSIDLKSLIIPLSLLIFFIMVTLFIWLMLKKHKQTKATAAAMTATEEEVMKALEVQPHDKNICIRLNKLRQKLDSDDLHSTITHTIQQLLKNRTEEEVTYCNIEHTRKTPSQTSYTESDVDVMYSSVVIRQKGRRKDGANDETVIYSRVA